MTLPKLLRQSARGELHFVGYYTLLCDIIRDVIEFRVLGYYLLRIITLVKGDVSLSLNMTDRR